MPNSTISALTEITGDNLATDDVFVVVDTSASATKKISVAELKLGIMPSPGPVGAETPNTGSFTDVATQNVTLPKQTNTGIKVDIDSPTFGWRDMTADIQVRGGGAVVIRGGVRLEVAAGPGLAG